MTVEPSTSEFSLLGKIKGHRKYARMQERMYRSSNDNKLNDSGDGVFKDGNVCNSSTSKYKMKKKSDSNEESESYYLNSTEEFNFLNGVTAERSINNEVNCLSKKKKKKHKRKLVELEEDSFNTDAAKKSKKRRLYTQDFSPSNDRFSEKEVTTSKKKKKDKQSRSEQCSLDETLNEFNKPEKRTSNSYLSNTIEPNSSFKENSRDDVYEFSSSSQEKERRALNSSKIESMFSSDDFNASHYVSKKKKKKKKKRNHTESYGNADEETNNDTLTSSSNFLEQLKNNGEKSEHTEEFKFSQDLFSQTEEYGHSENNVNSDEKNEVENSGNNNEDSVIDDSTTITRKQKKSKNSETKSNVNKFRDFCDVEQNYNTEEDASIALELTVENIPELHKRSLQSINEDEIRSLKDSGIYVRQGRWSFEEKSTLKANWHKLDKDYKEYKFNELFFQRTTYDVKRKIIQYLGQGLSTRTPLAIYQKTRELFGKRVSGRFTDFDKDKVKELVSLHGKKWRTIGECFDRSGKSVFDAYRKIKKERNTGVWKHHEKQRLIKAIKDIVGEDKFTFDNKKVFVSLPWKKIAKIVNSRNTNQCRQEWLTNSYEVLLTKEEAEIVKMWDDSDNRKLITKMQKLKVKDHNDIDWYKLAKKFRYSVSDYEQKSFTVVLDEISNFLEDVSEI